MCSLLYFSFLHTLLDPSTVLRFFSHFVTAKARALQPWVGPSIQMSHDILSLCVPRLQPLLLSFCQGRNVGSALLWKQLVLVLSRGGPKDAPYSCKGWSWSSDPQPQHRTVSPPAQTCSFAAAGHQRNLVVNHKLLSTPPSEFLGVIGSSPAIFAPHTLEKVQAEEYQRHAEVVRELMDSPPLEVFKTRLTRALSKGQWGVN